MSPVELLVIIKEHAPKDIWQGSPVAGYRLLGNTNRGAIGEKELNRALGGISTCGTRRREALPPIVMIRRW